MPRISDENRQLWLWLLNDGGAWTVADLAVVLNQSPDRLFEQLNGMAHKGLLEKLQPVSGMRRLRYGVTGTCRVPQGLCVAEVQGGDAI